VPILIIGCACMSDLKEETSFGTELEDIKHIQIQLQSSSRHEKPGSPKFVDW